MFIQISVELGWCPLYVCTVSRRDRTALVFLRLRIDPNALELCQWGGINQEKSSRVCAKHTSQCCLSVVLILGIMKVIYVFLFFFSLLRGAK